MTKEEFGYYIMLFGCDDLGLEPLEIIFFTDFYMGYSEVNALARIKSRKIALREAWFKQATYEEIAITIFHEIRHFYQHKKIMETNNYELDVDGSIIQKWRKNLDNIILPNGNNDLDYISQDIEQDAYHYALKTLEKLINLL